MERAGLPVLPHQEQALERAGQALEAAGPGCRGTCGRRWSGRRRWRTATSSRRGRRRWVARSDAERRGRLALEERGRAAVRGVERAGAEYEAAGKAYDWKAQRQVGTRMEAFAKALKRDPQLDSVLRERGRSSPGCRGFAARPCGAGARDRPRADPCDRSRARAAVASGPSLGQVRHERGSHEPEDDGDATRAFEALREEVAALRRGIELVYRQGQRGGPVRPGGYAGLQPDAGEDGEGAEGRRRSAGRGGAPAGADTDAGELPRGDRRGGAGRRQRCEPAIYRRRAGGPPARDLEALAGRVREQWEQRVWLAIVGVAGLLGGVLLWFMLIVILPWGAGDWLAALPLGGGPWRAGEALMQRDSPASFDRMVRLYKACGEQATELCEAAITVRAIQPGQEGGRNGPASAPSRLLPRGSHGGQ